MRMKGGIVGINDLLLLGLSLAVLLAVISQASGLPGLSNRGMSAIDQRQLDNMKADQLKQLEGYYNSFMKTEGGVDSYEASLLIASVIGYTWTDCSGVCREAGDIPEFTRFFLDHPIIISKQLNCDKEYEYEEGEKYRISKNSIRGMCSDTDLFGKSSPSETKTKRVDEWTVTAWGLKSTLCKNFIVEGKQWGNAYCKNGWVFDDADTTKYKCKAFCATGGINDWGKEITSDRILVWERILEFEKYYNNIKVTYDPDCTRIIGKLSKIPVIGGALDWLYGLKQSCSMVEINEGTTNPTISFYSSASSCYYGTTCPAQNPPINAPYESQCPSFSSYSGSFGTTICLYGTKCCGSEAYCAETLVRNIQPTPSGCVQTKCWYKNSQIYTSGKTCSASGCI